MDNLPALSTVVRARLAAAWAALAAEDLTARLWRPVCLLAMFIAVALTDILPALSPWAHLLVLLAAAGSWAWSTWRSVRDFKWPAWAAARTRLELSHAASHRPLTAVTDVPAGEMTADQLGLWRLHQERARRALPQLMPAWPRPVVAARDPLTLRAAAALALFIALAGAWGDSGPRLGRALWPAFDGPAEGIALKIWITPPAYTGRSPVFVETPAASGTPQPDVLEIPEHSRLLAVVTGSGRETYAAVGDTRRPLEKLADASQRLETDLPAGDTLEIRQRGRTLGTWRLKALPDLPPRVAFTADPREAGRWRLRLEYRAADDYGIAAIKGRITLPQADAAEAPGPADAFEFDVAAPPFSPRDVANISLQDLTAHPWAGREVDVQLIAVDHAGQSSASGSKTVVLPERVFSHPVARELAAVRKGLLTDPQRAIRPALGTLSAILQNPQSFGGDARVYLELSTAKYRLAYHPAAEAAATLPPVLWAAAVRIEDGNLAVAERNLDEAERAVQEAMERGAAPAELERLLAELQRAIAEYARELAGRMPAEDTALSNSDPNAQSIGPEDIAAMMQELRQMAQMGAQEAARQKLAQLQNMLQALRSAATANSNNPDIKAAQELLQDLKTLAGEQSALLEETFRQLREAEARARDAAGHGAPRPGAMAEQQQRQAAERQERIRQKLGELMGRMAEAAGQVPRSMGDAEGEMRTAREALKDGALQPASETQAEALAHLQDGMREAADQLMQALAEKGVSGMMAMPGGSNGNDPLGRGNRNGPDDGAQIELPDAPDANSMAERVRAILDEIRRRAADRTRSGEEQDYLRRLMKQF